MNPTDDNLPVIDDRQFDLLVDGELTEPQRRNLLATLDDVPGGWRRCALAFLEAQCWKEESRAIACQPVSERRAARAVGRRVFRAGSWAALLAMAASFLIAFGLGSLLRDLWRPGGQAGSAPIYVAETTERAETTENAEEPSFRVDEPDSFPPLGAPAGPWQMVTVPVGVGSGGGAGSIRLPAVERESIDEAWLRDFPPAVPADVLQAFERSGHQVRHLRRLLPVPLNDGRQLVVPVDQFEFRYVGDRAYQ